MCRSVPQIVVSVTRMTASPGPARGRSTSSIPNRFTPRNTFARMTSLLVPLRPGPIALTWVVMVVSFEGRREYSRHEPRSSMGSVAGARAGPHAGRAGSGEGRAALDLGLHLGHQVAPGAPRSEEHTSELQSLRHLVCRLLL